jgi:predicted nucleic acid-binding protein
MIVLDTNVVSELMRKQPDETVLRWAGARRAATLYMTAVTQAEILRGLGLLPGGARRRDLEKRFSAFLDEGFGNRILPFTRESAAAYEPIYTGRMRAGLGIGELDLLIAAIAAEHGATIATRNTGDFEGTGVRLVNPWLEA